MKKINLIMIHYSTSRAGRDFTETDLEAYHRQRGFDGIGYHFYIRKDGDIKTTHLIERMRAHAKSFNQTNIGICYEDGLNCHGQPTDTHIEWQIRSIHVLVLTLLRSYPGCRVCERRDLSPDLSGNREVEPEEQVKAYPCFDAEGGQA